VLVKVLVFASTELQWCGAAGGNPCTWPPDSPGNMTILAQPAYGPFISRNKAQQQGLRHYYIGSFCKHGHLAVRLVSDRNCVQCRKFYNKKRRADSQEAIRKTREKYYQKNKNTIMAKAIVYQKNRRLRDYAFAIESRLRRRFNHAIQKTGKAGRIMELVGCTRDQLVAHMEAQFLPGMSWENRSEWHVDHIRPCASFDLTDPEQQRQCFHYTNLQPLWAIDNIRKGSKWNGR